MSFVHLHTHSHYSLLDGLTKIDDLVSRAKELGMSSLALTDHGNLYGAIEFYKKATKAGIKPIIGIEAYLAPGSRFDKNPGVNEKYYHLILLCQNETGWNNLLKLITAAYLEGFYYKPRIDKELLQKHHEGLIATSACLSGEISRLIQKNKLKEARACVLEYQNLFGVDNFYIEIGSHPNIKETVPVMAELINISKDTGIPLVATQDIHYLKKDDAHYHDILLAVQTGNKLSDDDRLTLKQDDFSMRSPEEMIELFKDHPEAIENTLKISERCNLTLKLGRTRLPSFQVPENENSNSYLKKLLNERLPQRFKEIKTEINDRLNFELRVIEKMGFADYFLIVQDFVNWAKSQGIVVGPGRGSAAGSLVSYVLGITDIDPLKYDLLFERFLNPERIQLPDIDIDFTDRRRDEVLNYVKQKYGAENVAQIITFGTMAARAAIRDAGRALGLSYGFCDQIAKLIPFNFKFTDGLEKISELAEMYKINEDAKKVIDAARKLEGVVRHASTHACGVVISPEPLTNIIPLQFSPQDQTAIITQLEMHSIEDLGLLKMDFLGLKNLTIIEDTIRLVYEIKDEKIDMSNLPLDDQLTFKLLQRGETTGVFQFESSGMKRYMKELKPTELEDLIALVALYRPGPIELIPNYIKRKHGEEKITYLHPKLEPVLANTYGVGVYQEQMMRIARDLAGFSLAEADTLRKAIGKKIKKLLDEQQEKLIKGMIQNGINTQTAQAIWELFPPFARYGFNRCLTGDTKILNPETGELLTILEIYKNPSILPKIYSMESNLKISTKNVSGVIYNGEKKVFRIMTKSGRSIRATANHPFFTPSGWRNLENIQCKEKIAVPRIIKEPNSPISFPSYKLALLGYLLAEGNFCHPSGFYFYSKNTQEIDDYVSNLEQFENTIAKIDKSKSAIAVYAKRINIKNPSTAVSWIESLGLKYKKATQKFFPNFIYKLSKKDLAIFIAKMFQGDGCINIKRPDPQIFYATSSHMLATGLQHLLLRFGILSTIHKKNFKYRGGVKIGYTVTISRYDNIKKFINYFEKYLVGEKAENAKYISKNHPIINGKISKWAARGSYDTIPASMVLSTLRQAVYANNTNLVQFARSSNLAERLFMRDSRKIGYLRETIKLVAEKTHSKKLIELAKSDIYWDEIIGINPDGIEDTYDLSVPETHNFIANDIIVHNSHAACYALIGYRTAYLKARYPVEFMSSLLNADANDIERIAFLIKEANSMNIEVLPPDVNKSVKNFTPEELNIRFGLLAIKNIGEKIAEAIVEERMRGGPFSSFEDLITRVNHKDLNKKSLEALLKSGAMDSLNIERNRGVSNIEEILKFIDRTRKGSNKMNNSLFNAAQFASANLLNLKDAPVATIPEKLAWEKELLGLYISDHPLKSYTEEFKKYNIKEIREVISNKSISRGRIGGIITKIQRITTKNGQPMIFAKIEDLNHSLEVLVFHDVLVKNPTIWAENNIILVGGKMTWRDNEPKMICEDAKKL